MRIEGQLPFFIKARNPHGLRRLMLMNNARHGMTMKYFDIQFVKTHWYAWYYRPLQNVTGEDLEELSNGTTTE